MLRYSFDAFAKSKTISTNYIVDMCVVSPQQCTKFENKSAITELCCCGCKNYNHKWSCPPYAPTFSEISLEWARLYILYMRMPIAPFSGIKNKYLRIKAANTMLKSRADKYLRTLSKQYGKYISTGSCRLCKPCKFTQGKPCAYPYLMSYSFEALGIDVESLISNFFEFPLLWYRNGCLPDYTSVVCGLLTNDYLSLETIKQDYLRVIQA